MLSFVHFPVMPSNDLFFLCSTSIFRKVSRHWS
nr:MAG TPA: hypothetical protein [Caudoviricetes sp.]